MARAMIVSAGASSNEYLSARLTELGYVRPVIVPSGTEARRRMLEGGTSPEEIMRLTGATEEEVEKARNM